MSISVDEIQSRIASILDQNEDATAISTADYSLRLKYINMSLREWAEANDWKVLLGEYNMLVSTSTGNASIVMPSNFRKPASLPLLTFDGATTDAFDIVQLQDNYRFDEVHRRVVFLGNPNSGYVMRVYGTTLTTGASVKVPYYASPQSLASPTNISEVPNPDFLVKRSIAYWWEAREDARFVSAKSEAQQILQNMIEYENVFPVGADYGRVKSFEETTYNFRLGRD